ncbi:hypothetical protein O6H91_Y414100 [Diphasiastrum complanatum]|nr:hypothetical protein O6H91_Y414100 [Diphasiastrum complanatum]
MFDLNSDPEATQKADAMVLNKERRKQDCSDKESLMRNQSGGSETNPTEKGDCSNPSLQIADVLEEAQVRNPVSPSKAEISQVDSGTSSSVLSECSCMPQWRLLKAGDASLKPLVMRQLKLRNGSGKPAHQRNRMPTAIIFLCDPRATPEIEALMCLAFRLSLPTKMYSLTLLQLPS